MPFKADEAVRINAIENDTPLSYKKLNQLIHDEIEKGNKRIILDNVAGQRFIGAALHGDIKIYINGVPGNDLGIFMDGPKIYVNGNSEDQVGNTMNSGKIVINGNTGDVTGLSARGGEIFIKGSVGYRVGIHVKEYKGKMPKLVIGGVCKEYFGEYMAGGMLIVLGLKISDNTIEEIDDQKYGNCLGSGIHGGSIFIRTEDVPEHMLGIGAKVIDLTEKDNKRIQPYIEEFCTYFGVKEEIIWKKSFKKIVPASKRPYGSNYCIDLV
ncbi:MAG: hypothetical protein GF364_22090 [Candidatus Lokiarchaeota archaeon]|nr:hypothetical protein [Candidatus Lokiarchaeota archaeon]